MDTANEMLLGRAAGPEMDRQERVIFTVYVAMIAMIVAFFAVVGLAAGLGA
jgi:hypothetical protein